MARIAVYPSHSPYNSHTIDSNHVVSAPLYPPPTKSWML